MILNENSKIRNVPNLSINCFFLSTLLGHVKKVGLPFLISQDLSIETMTFRQSQNWLSSARRRAKEGHLQFDHREFAY